MTFSTLNCRKIQHDKQQQIHRQDCSPIPTSKSLCEDSTEILKTPYCLRHEDTTKCKRLPQLGGISIPKHLVVSLWYKHGSLGRISTLSVHRSDMSDKELESFVCLVCTNRKERESRVSIRKL